MRRAVPQPDPAVEAIASRRYPAQLTRLEPLDAAPVGQLGHRQAYQLFERGLELERTGERHAGIGHQLVALLEALALRDVDEHREVAHAAVTRGDRRGI